MGLAAVPQPQTPCPTIKFTKTVVPRAQRRNNNNTAAMPKLRAALGAAAVVQQLAAVAQAAHLAGPMDDRLKACIATNCPAMGQAMNAPNFGGLGVNLNGMSSFGAFVAPPMNGGYFINDMNYALRVMGYINKPITYRKVMNGPATVTATVNSNITDAFICGCEKCAATVEAIFQPVGRMVCKKFGHDLPCATEMDACIKDNPLPTSISTGSMATDDLKFTPVPAGKKNSAVCWPEASFSAYKVGWNLTKDCNAAGTALAAGGGASALALAKCVAKSRTEAYQADFNCLDVGGLTCGAPYKCTKPPPPPAYTLPMLSLHGSGTTNPKKIHVRCCHFLSLPPCLPPSLCLEMWMLIVPPRGSGS
jgi:hypothetical protein